MKNTNTFVFLHIEELIFCFFFWFNRTLNSEPVYIIDNVPIKEAFFIVTPWWVSATLSTSLYQQDFIKRSIKGFIQSSPLSNLDPCKQMSELYFNGTIQNQYHDYIKKLAENDCQLMNQIINGERVNSVRKTTYDLKINKSHGRNVIDILLCYIHSPLQTRHDRVPFPDNEVEESFQKILKHVSLQFHVQKVSLNNQVLLPHRKLVSKNKI